MTILYYIVLFFLQDNHALFLKKLYLINFLSPWSERHSFLLQAFVTGFVFLLLLYNNYFNYQSISVGVHYVILV